MKDFHAWLIDITNDLRAEVEPPRPEPKALPEINPNRIHNALISAIKSVAWRAQNKLPMEDRIVKKIEKVMELYSQIYKMVEREVKQGLRHKNELHELGTRTGDWVGDINMVILRHKLGEVPRWPRTDQYAPFHIKS